MSDPNSTFVDRGNPITGDAGPTVGGPNSTYAAPSIARGDAPVQASSAAPITAAEHAHLKAELAKPGAKFSDVMNAFWTGRNAATAQTGQDTSQAQQANGPDASQSAPEGKVTDAQIDAHVRAISDGAVNGAALFAADTLVRPVIDEMSKLDVANFNRKFDQGIAEVEKTIYGGNADAFAAGLGEMAAAAVRLTGSKEAGAKLMNDIDASGILSNPGVHYKLLTMARQLLGRRTSVFK